MNIQPGVEYTREQVAQMREDPELAKVLLRGYVFTLTIGGNFMLIPWNQAAGGGHSGKGTGYMEDTTAGGQSSYGRPVQAAFDKSELPPIVKRTPQQRLDSLMSKVGDDLALYIAGKEGKIPSGEDTAQVARAALQVADDEFEAKERKLITRTTGSQHA